jgi:hypothetical protein
MVIKDLPTIPIIQLFLLCLDNCHSSDVHFGDKCYRKTKFDGQESNKIDWYNGETYCRQSDIQGDIAYSYLDDYSSTKGVRLHLGDNDDIVKLWIGVRKRIWFWKKGKVISNYTKNKSFSYVYIINF